MERVAIRENVLPQNIRVLGLDGRGRIKTLGILMKLLQHIMEKQSDRILEAMVKVNNGGTVEDIDVIVRDYLYLIRKTYKGPEIQKITQIGRAHV